MKILHTADWHLGKSLNQFPLLADQEAALDQLLAVAAAERPDVVVLAGDIYDRAVPPAEAVALFNRTVSRLVLDLNIPLVAIAGNHDNAERIHYGAQLFEKQGFYVCGQVSCPLRPVVLADAHGPVYFYLLPYTEPETLRYLLRQAQQTGQVAEAQAIDWLANLQTHQQVMEWAVAQIAAQHQPGDRTVLVAHAFVQGGEPSESERKLLVGGAEFIDPVVFEPLTYTALGHLHQPQHFGEGRVRYAGSLLKYSISEAKHQKSFTITELGPTGQVVAQQVDLVPWRNLWVVRGDIREGKFALASDQVPVRPDDYLFVKLQNADIQANAMSLIQQQYRNAIGLEWAKLADREQSSGLSAEQVRQMSEEDLIGRFYQEVTGKEIDQVQAKIIHQTLTEIRQEA
jgi:exonuclease SbcD